MAEVCTAVSSLLVYCLLVLAYVLFTGSRDFVVYLQSALIILLNGYLLSFCMHLFTVCLLVCCTHLWTRFLCLHVYCYFLFAVVLYHLVY